MKSISNSKILITGGAGFIGSTLADKLIESNTIVIVDDLSMGKVENLPKSDHLHFFEHSITDTKFMEKLLVEWNFDYIYLMAAIASVADTVARPLETHAVNLEANVQILDVIRRNKLHLKKLLFTSSAAVYGNNPELPKKETSSIQPLTPYAIDKYASGRYAIDYGILYNIPTVVTRFFNVYGPKQNPESPYSGVLSLIGDSANSNTTFHVFGNGEQTRDFVYVDDVVQALILLMIEKQSVFEAYNVATGESTSLNEIIGYFKKISGVNFAVEYNDNRAGDILDSVASIDKISELGYEPQYDVLHGLEQYWQELHTIDEGK
jgi:UDP-glucose 4-epimerase